MTEKLKPLLKNKNGLIVVVLLGILLLVATIPVDGGDKSSKSGQRDNQSDTIMENTGEDLLFSTVQDYCTYMEEKLEKSLAKVDGAGAVDVIISMKSTEEKVVEKDMPVSRSGTVETDSQGGSRQISSFDSGESTVYSSESGTSVPYVVKTLLPKVEGVIVIAQGAGNGSVSKNISDAIEVLFGIDAHKIKVVKMKTQ
ncbi:MAG: stage III sporulation protein AG [Lachnospiraceae bacterium]|nr:stage III sporulation protein AG [Lachnospiraceae bacterium]